MAINYTISYTFAPNTTIASAQVNQNFSDNANTWTGLEAETKSFAKLKVDATPASANEVAIKSYVDGLMAYRRPVLQYSSGTVVNIETGINGASGQAQILFPDGNLRTDSTTGRINCNLAQVAALSGVAQSGLRTGSQGTNVWYAVYAVKVSDSTTNFVTVADTVLPVQASFATLNSNFGTSSWVYLGLIRNGDNNGTGTTVMKFIQAGNRTIICNLPGGGTPEGFLLASTSGTSSNLSFTYSAGTGTVQIPAIISHVTYSAERLTTTQSTATSTAIATQVGSNTLGNLMAISGTQTSTFLPDINPTDGVIIVVASTDSMRLWLKAWVDGVLGVGSNPLL